MTYEEYENAILRAARISEALTLMLNEHGMDLFEAYGNVYESIIKYEMKN